ncbi:MAG: endo-1,4-beta-xylanase [Tannerellaceae bacterium]|nr:endo-1,4-beta-xylanase [Tannerellaceae bacterium]
MKYYNKFWLTAGAIAILSSCVDDNLLDYSVEKPESIAVLEYLNQYDVLKSYVDRGSAPNFKLGAGVEVGNYNAQSGYYSLISSNFDEMTSGWEMKHGAVVQSDGSLDLTTVEKFISSAQAMGVTIYGHTLCWHSNQNASYLNSLIASEIIPAEPVETELITNGDFENGSISGWGGWGNDTAPSISDAGDGYGGGYALKLQNNTPKQSWEIQAAYDPANPFASGEECILSLWIRGDRDGSISFDAQDTSDWTGDSFGKAYFSTEWKYVELKTTITGDNRTRFLISYGDFEGTVYLDNISLVQTIVPSGTYLEESIITNGDFENGTIDGWGGWGKIDYDISQPGQGAGGTGYAVEIINLAAGNPWDTQFAWDFPFDLEPGGTYYVSFDMRAEHDNVSVGFGLQNKTTYAGTDASGITLSTEWKTFDWYANVPDEDVRDRFLFSLGATATTYYLDNVVFSKVSEMGEVIEKTSEEKEEIIGNALEHWISEMVEGCKSYVTTWDVVNEPMSDWPDATQLKTGIGNENLAADEFYWQDYLGKDYAAIAFKLARAYGNETDIHFINDYGLESNLTKCKGLIDFVEYTESRGARIDGIGTQMHISINHDREKISQMFEMLAATGKLIKVSELDIALEVETPTEEEYKAQYDMYRYIVETYKAKIPVSQQYGITIWCPLDSPEDSYWLPGEEVGLWTLDYTRKRSYAGVADGLAGKTLFEEE